jgi:uncharacterized protein YbjT (DUF2867 family)
MKALIIGATGATGIDLVNTLLQDPAYTEVVAFVRRHAAMNHPKLTQVQTDFENLGPVVEKIQGDILFSCLGTTRATAGSLEKQWHIDYEIPTKFAKTAKGNGIETIVLLSAYGASSNSNMPYSQMKGKLEEYIDSQGFGSFIVFRPGLLLRKESDRFGERFMAGLLGALSTLGIVRRFKPMPTQVLAEKMSKAPLVLSPGKHIIELNKIFAF